MCKVFRKNWPQGLWDYNVWRQKEFFFPLCPTEGKATCSLWDCWLRLASNHQLPASLTRVPITPLLQNFTFSSYPHFFAHVVNSWWLALSHAHLAQISPKFFVSPWILIHRSKDYEICNLAKLIPRCMLTKNFKKTKNKMRSSDTTQTPICPM